MQAERRGVAGHGLNRAALPGDFSCFVDDESRLETGQFLTVTEQTPWRRREFAQTLASHDDAAGNSIYSEMLDILLRPNVY